MGEGDSATDAAVLAGAGAISDDPTGGGAAALGGGGGGGSDTLSGDVTGPATTNVVEQIQETPIPAPVAGSDAKFVKYDLATLAFLYAYVTMAGDVTGTNPTTTVEKIRGKNVPLPGATEDKQALYYNNGGSAFAYARFSALTVLGAWTQVLISALGVADAEINNAWAGSATVLLANPMPKAGALVALSVKLTGDVGAAGNDLVVTVYKGGVATAVTGTISGGAGTEDEFTGTFTPVAFAAGDDITVQAKRVGTPGAVQAVVTVWGFFDP